MKKKNDVSVDSVNTSPGVHVNDLKYIDEGFLKALENASIPVTEKALSKTTTSTSS